MKYAVLITAGIGFVAGGILTLNWSRDLRPAGAGESTGAVLVKKAEVINRKIPALDEDRVYPAFGVHDVIDRLTSEVERLINQNAVKNSAQLREGLDRPSYTMTFAPPADVELSSEELYRQAVESVFLIAGMSKPADENDAWQTSFSTAFAVHKDGILSTSAHVFDHGDHDDAVVVMDISGQVYPVVEVLAANRKSDTCLFRIHATELKPMRLGSEIAPGSQVRVIGHPGDSFFFFSAGHLANYEKDLDGHFWLNITADFGQGSSGGPVMDRAGNIIGQVSRTYTLYAGGEASNRGRRRMTDERKEPMEEKKEAAIKEESETGGSDRKKRSDPQMVFKACTPVSAIRELAK